MIPNVCDNIAQSNIFIETLKYKRHSSPSLYSCLFIWGQLDYRRHGNGSRTIYLYLPCALLVIPSRLTPCYKIKFTTCSYTKQSLRYLQGSDHDTRGRGGGRVKNIVKNFITHSKNSRNKLLSLDGKAI